MRSAGRGVVVMFALIGVIATIEQLRGQGGAPLDGASFTHLGIVVRDVDRTARMFADVYGITVPAASRIYDNNGRGLPIPPNATGNRAAKVKLMQFTAGNLRIEQAEPNNPFGYVDLTDQLGFTMEVSRQPAPAPAAPARQ